MQAFTKYLLIIIMIAGGYWLFRGSSDERITAEGKIQVEFWIATGTHEEYPASVKLFNESQDSIEVIPRFIPFKENEKKILTAILSGNPPDVITQFSPIARWGARRALIPLNEYIKKDQFDPDIFYPALWKEMHWKGKVFGLPSAASCYGLFYNKRLFREAGLDPNRPPKTWDEVKAFSRKLTIRDEKDRIVQAGFIPNYGNLTAAIAMAHQFGATLRNEDYTEVRLDEQPMIDAMKWTVDFYDEYGLKDLTALQLSCGYAEQHGFNSERVAMMILDNSHIYQIQRYSPQLDYGISIIPYPENGETATQVSSFWLAIPRGAKYPDAAWKFLKYSVRKETQLAGVFMMDEPLLPANRFAIQDSAFLEMMPSMRVFDKLMYRGFSASVLPLVHEEFWREYFLAMERALNHKVSVDKALETADQRVQHQLSRAIEYDNYVDQQMQDKNSNR